MPLLSPYVFALNDDTRIPEGGLKSKQIASCAACLFQDLQNVRDGIAERGKCGRRGKPFNSQIFVDDSEESWSRKTKRRFDDAGRHMQAGNVSQMCMIC